MRYLAWTVAVLLLPLTVAAVLVLAALDRAAVVTRGETISPRSIAQARSLLASNDPRQLQRGDQRTADIPATLIDEAINYLASRGLHGRGAFVLAEESAEIRLTVRAPGPWAARYLNLSAVFREAEGEPHVAAAKMGTLPIPSTLVEWLLASAVKAGGFGDEWQLTRQSIRRLVFEPARGMVGVTYVWEPGILDHARSRAFSPEDMAYLQAAQRALAGLLDHHAARARVPLTTILPPLLTSAGDGTQRQARASLLVLATYLAGESLATLLPEARQWPRPRPLRLTLLGRDDSAQHFGISAALAAWAGEPAANAIGLYKELDDSRGGSGFSFADLAADRAGTRFGQLVAQDSTRLKNALRGTLTDAELAPPLGGLPEYLSADEFQRRFGGRGNAAYQQQLREIERRVAALPLYR